MPIKIDLTGQRFGRLTALYRNGSNNQGLAIWHCKCDCGNECDKVGTYLRDGSTSSCGCYQKDCARKKQIKFNTYDLSNDYGIGYTLKDEPFYFDKEDYPIIKDYCWRLRNDGYLDAKIRDGSGKRILMHNLIMGEKHIDHIGGFDSRNDNRRNNLRSTKNYDYSFETYNNMNKSIQSNNKSGYPGVTWHNRDKIWECHISINKKQLYLGRFDNLEDAVNARKQAEEQYFGKWSYDNSQSQYNK